MRIFKSIKSIFIFLSVSSALAVFSCAEKEKEKTYAIDDSIPFYLHQIDLENKSHGDCIFCEYGQTDILIDIGGTKDNSSQIIEDALNKYVSAENGGDDVIEYVIISHQDSDHNVNFPVLCDWLAKSKTRKINYLIDYDSSSDFTVTKKDIPYIEYITNSFNTTNYIEKRKDLVKKGKIEHYFTASQCTYLERSGLSNREIERINKLGARNIFDIYDDPINQKNKGGELRILYNYYYDHPLVGADEVNKIAAARNLPSVCSLITIGKEQKKLLFTGDLEEFDSGTKNKTRIYGETYLVDFYKESRLLENITFYKAAHHGSQTSNSRLLLDVIKPQYIGISCCADGDYYFPNQTALTNMLNWTDYIFVTSYFSGGKLVKHHGTINVEIVNSNVDTYFENTKANKSIYHSDWFVNNRIFETQIINFEAPGLKYSNCTYIKMGHIDIVVNAGAADDGAGYNSDLNNKRKKTYFVDKILNYCNDKVIDYFIISNCDCENYSDLIRKDGLLDKDITISNFIYAGYSWYKDGEPNYNKLLNVIKNNKKITNIYNAKENKIGEYLFKNNSSVVINYLSEKYPYMQIDFINCGIISSNESNKNETGLPFVLKVVNQKAGKNKNGQTAYFNSGDIFDINILKKMTKEIYSDLFNNSISFLQIPKHGYTYLTSNSEIVEYRKLFSSITTLLFASKLSELTVLLICVGLLFKLSFYYVKE